AARAVRCFLMDVPDQYGRYKYVIRYIGSGYIRYVIGFRYLEQGIRIQGAWYPILKMEWVDGSSLDRFVDASHANRRVMYAVSERFRHMGSILQQAGVAHGDLQHGNIMVTADDLRLVDYDGMFVPELQGEASHELGHPNYQHPLRSAHHFGRFLDN